MNPAARIALFYAIIAGIAAVANLLTQMLVMAVYRGPFAIQFSMAVALGAALPVKYMLEKRFIFAFTSDNLRHDGALFFVYSFLGLFTTAIFWIVEQGFQWTFGTDAMRYVGAAIGLALGNWCKYHLDKRFVFARPTEAI